MKNRMVFIGLLMLVYLSGLGFGAELANASGNFGFGIGLLAVAFPIVAMACLAKWEMEE